MESRIIILPNLNRFKRGKRTNDPVMCLRKVQVNNRKGIWWFQVYDMEKAHAMIWKEELIIKLDLTGIAGRTHNNGLKSFYSIDSSQIGAALSGRYVVRISGGSFILHHSLLSFNKTISLIRIRWFNNTYDPYKTLMNTWWLKPSRIPSQLNIAKHKSMSLPQQQAHLTTTSHIYSYKHQVDKNALKC